MKQLILMSVAAGALLCAESEGTRGIVPEHVLQARPKAAATVAAPKYKAVGTNAPTTNRPAVDGRQVGVTIWRLRPAAAADSGVRILVQDDAGSTEFVPERVASTSRLKPGDKVRLTIESPEVGYLYVIDRERYANGERGKPFLIFPTTRTRGGDNKVSSGQLVDIPGQDDRPNFFRLSQTRSDQAEEELTVLLTKAPLEGLDLGPRALALTNEQVLAWEKQWGTSKIETFELTGGSGKAWTKAEQQASAGGTRRLTQEDPPPQTVYKVMSKEAEPFMVKIRLRYQ